MVNTDDCWLWAGYKESQGYGQIFYREDGKNKYHYAHRFMYEQLVGKIPEGLVIDHLCRVRHCINPDHLEVVTPRVNNDRGIPHNQLKTHCPRGHAYAGDNLLTQKSGKYRVRRCKVCVNTLQNARRH